MSHLRPRHVLLAALLLAVPLCRPAAAQTYTLQKLVVLSRHSIRPPDLSAAELAQLSSKSWPDPGPVTGGLTAQGATDATLLGAYTRLILSSDGLLAPTGCPRPNDVFIWGDNRTTRTVTTGTLFGEGLYPGCGVTAASYQGSGNDPLFETTMHPRAQPRKPTDVKQLRVLKNALGATQNPCITLSSSANPSFTCSVAADLADEFRLQYANDLPYPQIGFGVVSDYPDLMQLLALYTHYYDGTYALPKNGRVNGAKLATQISQALSAGSDATGAMAARLLVYVGHDATIASLRGLLKATWKEQDGRPNDTPPLSSLMFALLRDGTGAEFVSPLFLTVTPSQLRGATALTLKTPPDIEPVIISGCTSAGVSMCTLDTFKQIVAKAIQDGKTSSTAGNH